MIPTSLGMLKPTRSTRFLAWDEVKAQTKSLLAVINNSICFYMPEFSIAELESGHRKSISYCLLATYSLFSLVGIQLGAPPTIFPGSWCTQLFRLDIRCRSWLRWQEQTCMLYAEKNLHKISRSDVFVLYSVNQTPKDRKNLQWPHPSALKTCCSLGP